MLVVCVCILVFMRQVDLLVMGCRCVMSCSLRYVGDGGVPKSVFDAVLRWASFMLAKMTGAKYLLLRFDSRGVPMPRAPSP